MNKYEWIEGVMSSKASTGVKVFAFGLFKHMDHDGNCYPGDKALADATGMSRGHFSKYRRLLVESGWLSMEPRKTRDGDSYYYSIPESAPVGGILTKQSASDGKQNASDGKQSASDGKQSAPVGGMNTVINTTRNTVDNTFSDEPVIREEENYSYDGPLKIEDFENFSLTKKTLAFEGHLLNSEGVTKVSNPLTLPRENAQLPEGVPEAFEERSAKDWRSIRLLRSLTKEENDFITARAVAFNQKRNQERAVVKVGDEW